MRTLSNWIDGILCLALIAAAIWIVQACPFGFDTSAAASMAGALVGAAALLLGNWINRGNAAREARDKTVQHREKVKTLLGAELVNLAAGMIGAKQHADAAVAKLEEVSAIDDMAASSSILLPRLMVFTDALGVELCVLEKEAIDALATLRANLVLTRERVEEAAITDHFGLLKATALRNGIAHDMGILAEAFAHIAPTRKFQLPGQAQPRLASELLRELAAT